MTLRGIDRETLHDVIKECRSYRQALIKLNLVPAGGNYSLIQKKVREFGIPTQHMTGCGWNRGEVDLTIYHRIPLVDLLKKDIDYGSHKLKLRLFRAGLKRQLCEICGWSQRAHDGRLPLELDHINGDRRDNRLINLRILCPNCHSLTDTYRGKNKGRLPG